MADFATIQISAYQQDPKSVDRIGKKDILPGAIDSRHLNTDIIQSTGQIKVGPISSATGLGFYIVTKTEASANPNIPLGSLGIGVNWYIGSIDDTNIIFPGDSSYTMFAPSMVPTGDNGPAPDPNNPHFSNGNNLVFRTGFINNSGSTQNVWALFTVRFLMAIGGGGQA